VRISPSLQFLHPTSTVELSPEDARRLGIGDGEPVEVARNGTSVRGVAILRHAVPAGSVFVSDETALGTGALVEVRRAAGRLTRPPSGRAGTTSGGQG
jgi:anaerobic selenocysteine-containing dehydrogenase